ncbi:MoaD/ThiS family protein [Carboxydothermus pertinax]|uniref:Thiamine biosynthesis protein ThiS n=1 Tax=Carboxydothermus pertinax TaxID=870242 RepID=A0A1L8CVI1_9THEO|nr:MoaD/ThiS family protein [Carboxydothermus pertinax]GAV22926.1 hypothetical protein cpu_14360 [Carboxydothermus pertinax]
MVTVGKKKIEFKEGMTAAEALKIAGVEVDPLTLVIINGWVLTPGELNLYKLADGDEIKLMMVLAGG